MDVEAHAARPPVGSAGRAGAPQRDRRAEISFEGACWPTAEQQLLLKALLAPPDEARASFQAWLAGMDLDTLDSGSLSLMPLLYQRLRELGIDDPILMRLKGAHHFHWCKNHLRLRECLQGVDALLAAGCSVVVLKGASLLDRYGDPGLRPMADIDVLVPRTRAVPAMDALLASGWSLKYGTMRSEISRLIEGRHGYGFERGGAEIDVHWCTLAEDLSPAGDEGLRQRAEPFELGGRRLLRPCPTDSLLHTCVHGARFSRSMSVTWVPDSVLLVERCAIDWQLLVAEARRRVLELPLRETLRFLAEELGTKIPADVLEALRPREPAWLLWLEHGAYATDPNDATSWHRAALKVAARLRRGEPLPSGLVAPPPAAVAKRR